MSCSSTFSLSQVMFLARHFDLDDCPLRTSFVGHVVKMLFFKFVE